MHTLKIGYQSVAAGIKIIRQEEKKLKKKIRKLSGLQKSTSKLDAQREYLYSIRKNEFSRKARVIHLCRAYLSGIPYKSVEANTKSHPRYMLKVASEVALYIGAHPEDTRTWMVA